MVPAMRETEATKEDPDPNGARTRPTLEDQHDGPVVTLKLTLTTHRPGEVNLG